MNPDIKAKWLEALRSGKYQQGKSRLRADDRFCCIGVLCDVLNADAWAHSSVEIGEFYWRDPQGYKVFAALLPEALETTGLSSDQQDNLIDMNDNGESFETISAHIEKTL